MAVRFTFDIDKTIAAATYISSKQLPDLTIGKMFKLLFLADKDHLVRYGRTITGDGYAAMKDGPVPSKLYDLVKEAKVKALTPSAKKLSLGFKLDKASDDRAHIVAQAPLDPMQLSRSDIAALDRTIETFGAMSFAQLRKITHDTPAYEKAWHGSGSSPMKFEDFFENDPYALVGAKEEMLENYAVKKIFAKPSLV